MRPPHRILIASDNEREASVLAYVLRNTSQSENFCHYRVETAAGTRRALSALHHHGPFDLLIVLLPIAGTTPLLTAAAASNPYMNRLVLTERNLPDRGEYPAAHVVLSGAPTWRILEQVAILTKRKCGPRKKLPAVVMAPSAERLTA